MNNKLNTILQDTWKIPTLAVVLKKSKNRVFRDDYALYFLCEHTLELVPCGPTGEGFEFKQLKKAYADAFKKMAPILMVGLTMLKIAVTLYGIPIPLPDLSSLSKGDITSMLNDMMLLHLDVNEVDASIQAIASRTHLTSSSKRWSPPSSSGKRINLCSISWTNPSTSRTSLVWSKKRPRAASPSGSLTTL